MTDQADPASRWDDAYALGDDTRSWFEESPDMSLRMLNDAGASAADALIDVGGGASRLTGELLARDFRDLTVLDISAAGIQQARDHLGSRADEVEWLTADILRWHPTRCYRVWHDRAVFHFMTTAAQQQQYVTALDAATAPGALAVFGCFAPGAPQYCSGLPVARYTAPQLACRIGPEWELIGQQVEEHTTPAGTIQPFTWAALRRET
jgi:hypothetical protein